MKKVHQEQEKRKGHLHTLESRLKISLAHIGKKLSEEHRHKLSIAHTGKHEGGMKGKHHSEETKKKIREANKNQIPWIKGKRHSEETRQKIRENRKLQVFSEETIKKMSEAHKGEKSHLWKGGLTPISQQERRTFEIHEWRSKVFNRDDYACQMCGSRGGFLNAHHIELFSEEKELRSELSNGITLCKSCHQKIRNKEKEYAPFFKTLVLTKRRRFNEENHAPSTVASIASICIG